MGQFSKTDRKILIRQGKPIEELGLTFYPIQMCHYEEFLMYKDALTLRLSTLPVKYAVKDYLNAIFALEIDSVKDKGENVGLFRRAISLFMLSLRIEGNMEKFIKEQIAYRKVGKDEFEIDRIVMTQNNNTVEIKSIDFSTKLRKLIAEQNGVELPEEDLNTDLVKGQEELAELNGSKIKLNVSTDSLISSVAYNSKVSEREIDDWTVREFENRRKAIERDKKYTLYGQAEMSGMVSFKKGNPFPSWCYDSIDESMGTMSTSALAKQNGNVGTK